MIFEIEIKSKKGFPNPCGLQTNSDIAGIGIKDIKSVDYISVYRISGEISKKDITIIARELLIDKITEDFFIKEYENLKDKEIEKNSIEVWYKRGVTDTVSESVSKAIKDLGIKNELVIKTGKKYCLKGNLNLKKLDKIATSLLANTLIQEYLIK